MNMCKALTKILSVLLGLVLLSSCGNTVDIRYFQDTYNGGLNNVSDEMTITLRPKDKISIIVNSKDYQLTNMFNLPYVTQRIGQISQTTTMNYSQGVSGYTISDEGDIEFPVLGSIHVAGMTRNDVERYIQSRLRDEELVKDAIVTVDFMNLGYSVLGEVAHPGRYYIDRDDITILDAISHAGDLTILGERRNVLVQRMVDGQMKSFYIDLCSAERIYNSPVYYLQQNDVIYVSPNDVRARQSTVNGNNIRSSSFWISLGSLLTSATTLLINAMR